jgi:hypothetical protein
MQAAEGLDWTERDVEGLLVAAQAWAGQSVGCDFALVCSRYYIVWCCRTGLAVLVDLCTRNKNRTRTRTGTGKERGINTGPRCLFNFHVLSTASYMHVPDQLRSPLVIAVSCSSLSFLPSSRHSGLALGWAWIGPAAYSVVYIVVLNLDVIKQEQERTSQSFEIGKQPLLVRDIRPQSGDTLRH